MNKQERERMQNAINDVFGGQWDGDDVSLESANKASQMKPQRTETVKVYDDELGWVDEYVTVDAPVAKEEGTLRQAVRQFGQTFPESVTVTYTNWNGTHRVMSVEGDVEQGSVDIIKEDGSRTTLNPLIEVTIS